MSSSPNEVSTAARTKIALVEQFLTQLTRMLACELALAT